MIPASIHRPARPLVTALGIYGLFTTLALGAGVAIRTAWPQATGQQAAFAVLVVTTVLVLAAAPRFAPWSELGVNPPRQWRNLRLLVVPAGLALSPLVLGVRTVAPSLLVLLVVGYLLTGLTEELLWRGIVQRVLEPLGTTRAVLLTSALFGAAHLVNLVFRDGTGLVLAQAWGAFCFGVGYGALRTRINTIVPLMLLHFVTDLAAAVGAVPTIPVLVVQDVVLLALGLTLLHRHGDEKENAMNLMIAQLDRALHATGTIVSGVRADQWDLPTACAGWDVRTECNHLVGGMRIFTAQLSAPLSAQLTAQLTAQLSGQVLSEDHDDHDWLGPDPGSAYTHAAVADAGAWRGPAAETTVFDLAFGQVPAETALVVHLTEVVVHGLDLAVATGQEDRVDQELAGSLHALMSSMGTEAFRGPGIFGPELPARTGDPAHRRLLAYLGRELVPVPASAL